MGKSLLMFAVDENAPSRIVLGSIFGADYDVELFDCAETCLERLAETRPDILLLNVHLPGMGGFELCRRIKTDPATGHTPVIFLSSDESLETRLAGYDSGGEDFILKPFSIDEVKRRVEVVRTALEKSASLQNQVSDSELLSSLLLSNMDEYAVLLKFMRRLNGCADETGIADALLETIGGFRLDGAIQIRLPWEEFTRSSQGRDRPLEQSVMNHVRGLGRIFQFRQRCVYNYGMLTVLVNNMPWQDQETCGRLRDHLAIATETAEAKLDALALARHNSRTRTDIGQLVEEIRRTIDLYIQRYDTARYEGAVMTRELFDELAVSFAHLGMSHELEEDIEKIVRDKARSLVAIYDTGEQSTATLKSLGERLEKMLQ